MSTPIHHVAICQTCGWTCDTRNAFAAAQRHANAYEHQVEVQLGYVVTRKPWQHQPRRKAVK